MKTIVIGDIHGRLIWKDMINQEDFDKVIFIGDYFDSFNISGQQQIDNFLDIVEFKKAAPNDTILLVGNHDFHYLDIYERYSGFQKGWNYSISDALKKNLHLFQMCHVQDNYLFTHAGVSQTWCKNYNINVFNLEQSINDLFIYKPLSFRFQGVEPHGDNITQSPIWIRPNSLLKDGITGYQQIVGHTQQHSIIITPKIIFVDALQTQECLIIEDREIRVYKQDT